MTEKTVILGIRLNKGDKEKLSKYITRESLESILRQIERGEIEIRSKGVVIPSVNTNSESVNTSTKSVNTEDYCKGCEYMENALDMSKFNEVCEFKGLDRQKALDRCAQMLWR